MSRYTKVSLLGRGGMGEVWKVHDETLHCFWAMKCLKEEATNQQKQEFEHEIEILTKLHHAAIPRIVERIHSTGVIMDLIEGQPLSELTEKVEEERLMVWAEQLLDILAYLHAQGILYLDVKPANLILDSHNRLHLIDFGIAIKEMKSAERKCYGTFGYAPKEQYEQCSIDARADIYAFGKTMIALHENIKDVALLSKLNEHDTTFSNGMRILIHGCIQEQRDHRYQTVVDIQKDLHQLNRINKDIYQRIRKQRNVRRILTVAGALLSVLSQGCFYMQRQRTIAAYEGAIANKNYPLAITIQRGRQDAYERLYKETKYQRFQELKQTESLEDAFMQARIDALQRMQEVRLTHEVCDESFLMELVQDALLTQQSTWYPFVDVLKDGANKACYQKLIALMDHFDAYLLDETARYMMMPSMRTQNAWYFLSMTISMQYELHQSELTKEQFLLWQTLLDGMIEHVERDSKVGIDAERKQLLYHSQMKSRFAYARYLRAQEEYSQMVEVFKELIALQQERKKTGKQDEQIACYGANAHLALFQEDPKRIDHLKLSKQLFEEALILSPKNPLALEGNADCERLMKYWMK